VRGLVSPAEESTGVEEEEEGRWLKRCSRTLRCAAVREGMNCSAPSLSSNDRWDPAYPDPQSVTGVKWTRGTNQPNKTVFAPLEGWPR
jgi:hypothetical protein